MAKPNEKISNAPTGASLLGRRLALACLGIVGISAAVGIGGLLNTWFRPPPIDTADRVRLGFAEYVAGHYDVARRLIERLEIDSEEQPELYRTRQFLLGATGVQLAAGEPEPDLVRRETALAIPYLQWSVQHGFPPGRSAEGQRLLGNGLSTLGRFADAIAPLNKAIEADPTLARELLLPLAEAKLRGSATDASAAIPDVERLLALPNLGDQLRAKALLLQGRVLTKLERWAEADAVLKQITVPELADAAEQATAERLIAEAQSLSDPDAAAIPPAAQKLFDRAIAMLEEMDRRGDDDRGAEARYLAGRGLRSSGREEEALALFSSLRQNRRQVAEAVSAGVEELELLAAAGRFSEAVEVGESIIREIGDPLTYDTKWLTVPVLKSRLTTVVEQLRSAGAFPEAIALAGALPPVFELGEALRMQGAAYRGWGEATLARAAAVVGGDAEDRNARREAREQLRMAGDAYAEAAEHRFLEPDYIDLLWAAIESYQAGRDFARSLELLDDYLRYESRARKSRGLIAQGRAFLALDDPEQAIRPLEACVAEYPRDPLRYEARLLAAVGRLALGEIDAARKSLEENLFDGRLAPSSPVYRDALYILGESMFRQAHREHLALTTPTLTANRLQPGDQPSEEVAARFTANQQLLEDAILRLDQAAERDRTYENLGRGRRAVYLSAEARRMAAHWPRIVAADPETLESARRLLNQQRAAHLSEAQQRYAELRQQLNAIAQRDGLETWELAMMRNCFLSEADMSYELDRLEEAADAYQNVSQQFMNEPIALEALLRQVQCFEQLGRDADAARVLQQTARMLERIPPEKDLRFTETTRYDRANWEALLEWLQ